MVKLPLYVKWMVLFFCWPTLVLAEPLFQVEADGAKIVLTDEPCKLSAVSNLKYRAVWHEKGQAHEGCWAPRPDMGVVMSYWADKTVTAIPIHTFVKVTGV